MKKLYMLPLLALALLFSCGGSEQEEAEDTGEAPKSMLAKEKPAKEEAAAVDPMQDKGIGPVTSVELGAEVDMELAKKGEEIYGKMCTACHKPDKDFIGPAPKGILERRTPEWIMNMILNPEEMIQKDPIAKDLLMKFNGAPMANQNLTEEEARAVLEYFRTL
ncbi:MAG TPA: cytochrome c [Flammeovirgaceae bacterium]|nr:cytochrome c [Flammeovirgaceae bacterium]